MAKENTEIILLSTLLSIWNIIVYCCHNHSLVIVEDTYPNWPLHFSQFLLVETREKNLLDLIYSPMSATNRTKPET